MESKITKYLAKRLAMKTKVLLLIFGCVYLFLYSLSKPTYSNLLLLLYSIAQTSYELSR